MGTALDVGPGAWELRAAGVSRAKKYKTRSTLQAIPTASHMALVELQRSGRLAFLVSQNTDGLHRRSGFPPEALSELHGNSNLEFCRGCGRQYLRDYHCRRAGNKVHDHRTGRKCVCGGELRDSIINFGENLPEKALTDAFGHARRADFCLVLGSSLRVTPAADVPEEVAERGGRLVIVNLQRTPLDRSAALVIHAKCDDVMEGLMTRLATPIPPFRLRRFFEVAAAADARSVLLRGIDSDGTPFSLFTGVRMALEGGRSVEQTKEPFRMEIAAGSGVSRLSARLHFAGHYAEPPLEVEVALPAGDLAPTFQRRFVVEYDPARRRWSTVVDVTESPIPPLCSLPIEDGAGPAAAPARVAPAAAAAPPRGRGGGRGRGGRGRGGRGGGGGGGLRVEEMEEAERNVSRLAEEMRELGL